MIKKFKASLDGKLRVKIRKIFYDICEVKTCFPDIDSQLKRTFKNKTEAFGDI